MNTRHPRGVDHRAVHERDAGIERNVEPFGGLDVGGADRQRLARVLDAHARDVGDEAQRGLGLQRALRDAAAQPLVDMQAGEQERRAVARMAPPHVAVGRRQLADRVRHVGGLRAARVAQDLDDRVVARQQQAGPVGRDLAPDVLLRPRADERALGAEALDQALVLEDVQRLADGRAGDAAFRRQLLDGRDLLPDRPLAGFDRRRNRLASWM